MNRKRPALFRGRRFQTLSPVCVRWHFRYALSYRDLEETIEKRGLSSLAMPASRPQHVPPAFGPKVTSRSASDLPAHIHTRLSSFSSNGSCVKCGISSPSSSRPSRKDQYLRLPRAGQRWSSLTWVRIDPLTLRISTLLVQAIRTICQWHVLETRPEFQRSGHWCGNASRCGTCGVPLVFRSTVPNCKDGARSSHRRRGW